MAVADTEPAPAESVRLDVTPEATSPLLTYTPALPAVLLLTYTVGGEEPSASSASPPAVLAPAADEEPAASPVRAAADERQHRPAGVTGEPVAGSADELTAKALALIGGGMSRRAVARELGVAESTLQSRLKRVLAAA